MQVGSLYGSTWPMLFELLCFLQTQARSFPTTGRLTAHNSHQPLITKSLPNSKCRAAWSTVAQHNNSDLEKPLPSWRRRLVELSSQGVRGEGVWGFKRQVQRHTSPITITHCVRTSPTVTTRQHNQSNHPQSALKLPAAAVSHQHHYHTGIGTATGAPQALQYEHYHHPLFPCSCGIILRAAGSWWPQVTGLDHWEEG